MENRVKEIEILNNVFLQYINTKQNSPELPTTEVLNEKLKDCWHGSSWLVIKQSN